MSVVRRRRRSLLAVLILAALALVTLDFRGGDDGPISEAQRLAMAAFAPLQDGLARVVDPIAGAFASVGELARLREEKAALEAEVQALRQQQLSLADLERENRELRELVGMRDRLGFTTTAARAIANPPGVARWSVLIDIGEDHGVGEGMAVIDSEGLVGRITQTTATHARVQLAISPEAGYAVRIAESGQQGLLSGRGRRPMELRVIDDPEAHIPDGAEVVTRAFPGTSVPDGIPVGEVEDPGVDQLERAQFLAVRPFVNFDRLDLVLVVLDAPQVPRTLEEAQQLEDADDGPEEPPDPDDAEQ